VTDEIAGNRSLHDPRHKQSFGKSKTVEEVAVFRPDKNMMPYMLFWVINAPPAAAAGETEMKESIGNATEMRNKIYLCRAAYRRVESRQEECVCSESM
jgi:hypothetical protein